MSRQNKFGTFSGVLTPSLLTILGVIMYMRLGSIVGNSSGIFQVILIILFAHLISITTGLSVSSIATDKKIDKGGIYYMLTRSLGLPIGGAIGLTIFIATAFSISLYLIGFSESIIPVINEDWAADGISINKLRFFGSIALFVVLIIAYVSTNFALKIQYVILGLIILSLGSIFLGNQNTLKEGSALIESPNFATLFGLFFPAVTGFTAGVAMSGDLRNPKISIPWGTMLSISIGLLVYLLLSVFIFYNIDGRFLRTNNNVLIEFGAVPLLVLCGVWGATISSALGGILGGPRILQAMSLDKITPKFFAKESGANKEPRNALFLTFFIAEIGILIGELNVIAELVAMFYMAAYLFINLSCFLEQWSSPDFRPKFKIPLWISLLGGVATLLLMIQLNLAATLVAVLFMFIFWFWLSKKDLVLGTGDVWLSVWNSIVKTGLKNLQKKTVHRRNWQPNILLFSGGTSNRPHLIEFGKNIIGRVGMVSNFDLIETKSAKVLFPKSAQNLKDDLLTGDSIFHRKLYCQNIFKGIESIATTYGFSGIEPNTVLMGWAKNTKDPIWFGQMTQKLKDLDYNILYLDYDVKKGFGNYNKIDLWWSEFQKENELSLQLIKFLRSSPRWKKALLNIYFVNSKKTNSKEILIKMQQIIDRKRMVAELHVVNNYLDQKELSDYVRVKSFDADLILMKLPFLEVGKEKDFINSSNDLFGKIGSSLFLEASNSFVDNLKIESDLKTILNPKTKVFSVDFKGSTIPTNDDNFDYQFSIWQNELEKINQVFINDLQTHILPFEEYYINIFNNKNLLNELTKHIYNEEKVKRVADDFEEKIAKNIKQYFKTINQFLATVSSTFDFHYNLDFLNSKELKVTSYNQKIRDKILRNNSKNYHVKIPVVKLFDHHLKNQFIEQFVEALKIFGNIHNKYIQKYNEHINQTSKTNILPNLEKVNNEIFSNLSKDLNLVVLKLLNAVIIDIGENNIKYLAQEREENFDVKFYRKKWRGIELFPESFSKNIFIFHNIKALYCSSSLVKDLSMNQINQFSILINEKLFDPMDALSNLSKKKSALKKQLTFDFWIQQLETDFINFKRSLVKDSWQINYDDFFSKIPEEINLYSTEDINYFYNSQNNLDEKNYNLKTTLLYVYNEKIIFPLDKFFKDYIKWALSDLESLISSFKLVSFTQNNQKSEDLLRDSKKKLQKDIDLLLQKINLKKERLASFLDDLKLITSKFNDYQFLLLNESKKFIELNEDSNNKYNFEFIQNYISNKFIAVVDLLSYQELEQQQSSKNDKLNLLRDFLEHRTPSRKSLAELPKLYLQLFNDDTKPNPFFSSFISKQEKSIVNILSSVENSSQNVVVVSGESNSGKSYIISKVLKTLNYENCYEIDPPSSLLENITEVNLSKLLHAVKDTSSKSIFLKDLEKGSVVFLNNFELWWRKNSNDYSSITQWVKIFKDYTNKLNFVIEINPTYKKLLLNFNNFDNLVLKYVSTHNFSKKELEKMVDYKNNLVGVDIYNKLNKINFSNSFRSTLNFKNIQNHTSGNIGWFNQLWISSIFKNSDGFLEFSNNYDFQLPNIFSDQELIVLVHFYYHKKINLKALNEYFDEKIHLNINEIISVLKNENVLITEGVYTEINSFIIRDLIAIFKEKNLI